MLDMFTRFSFLLLCCQNQACVSSTAQQLAAAVANTSSKRSSSSSSKSGKGRRKRVPPVVLQHCPRTNCDAEQVVLGPKGFHRCDPHSLRFVDRSIFYVLFASTPGHTVRPGYAAV